MLEIATRPPERYDLVKTKPDNKTTYAILGSMSVSNEEPLWVLVGYNVKKSHKEILLKSPKEIDAMIRVDTLDPAEAITCDSPLVRDWFAGLTEEHYNEDLLGTWVLCKLRSTNKNGWRRAMQGDDDDDCSF